MTAWMAASARDVASISAVTSAMRASTAFSSWSSDALRALSLAAALAFWARTAACFLRAAAAAVDVVAAPAGAARATTNARTTGTDASRRRGRIGRGAAETQQHEP